MSCIRNALYQQAISSRLRAALMITILLIVIIIVIIIIISLSIMITILPIINSISIASRRSLPD